MVSVDHDTCALGAESKRRRLPDAATRSRHERGLCVKAPDHAPAPIGLASAFAARACREAVSTDREPRGVAAIERAHGTIDERTRLHGRAAGEHAILARQHQRALQRNLRERAFEPRA